MKYIVFFFEIKSHSQANFPSNDDNAIPKAYRILNGY